MPEFRRLNPEYNEQDLVNRDILFNAIVEASRYANFHAEEIFSDLFAYACFGESYLRAFAYTFRQFAAAYGKVAKRTTLYVSEEDGALRASGYLHSYPRAGFAPPICVVEGIDTVNVTGLDLSTLGHGYIAEARPLLTDIYDLIQNGTPPNRRFGLRSASISEEQSFWQMSK